MLNDVYDFTRPAKDVDPLLFPAQQHSTYRLPPVSLSQRLTEAESFILTLETMISRSLERERVLKLEVLQLKTENLGLRVDLLNEGFAGTYQLASDTQSTDAQFGTLPELDVTSKPKKGIQGLRYSGPANVMPSILDRLKNKIAGLAKYA